MATRQNVWPNPSCKNNATGWNSNTTVARTTSISGMPRSTGMLLTGNGFIQTPNGACTAGDIVTISFYVKNNSSFSLTGRTVYIAFSRSTGGDDYSQSATLPTVAPGDVVRFSYTGTAPANATGVFVLVDAVNGTSGTGIEFGSIMAEKVAGPVGTYFDGDSTFAVWDGADGNSTSTYTDPAAIKPGSFIPFL
jgi:hypothetical protein